jgi:hypothetical protein
MAQFLEWISNLMSRGESVQDDPPTLTAHERPAVERILGEFYEEHALDIAGPPIPFDLPAATEAAELLAHSCWLLVSGDEAARLGLKCQPSSPSIHLSVDLGLRFLPAVYRRSKSQNPDGKLTLELDRILRMWPLSGVLACLDGKPASPLDFAGHPGLQLLYAERLVGTGQPGWVPESETARGWSERVFQERGKPLPEYVVEKTDGD